MTFIITDPDGSQPTTTTNGTDPAHSKVHEKWDTLRIRRTCKQLQEYATKDFAKKKWARDKEIVEKKITKKEGGNHVGGHTCQIESKHEHTTN